MRSERERERERESERERVLNRSKDMNNPARFPKEPWKRESHRLSSWV